MDHVVKIKKGLDIQLEGIPSPKISNTPDSQLYAIIPDDFVGLTPKVIVKPGEKVLTGSPVIHDKTHPNIVVTSPVSGEIVTIERGERRKVIKITIKPDASQQALEFGRFDLEN
ncbi:MAG: NADH:ubiquinone reductase (Na(+)-transporting) subunit A, partial [Bacteroidaceae bacterium]|nr:NADH:ubiquinone reductase (Na(+)-transporting) subunit A [Bacteroidaceae bacterium]